MSVACCRLLTRSRGPSGPDQRRPLRMEEQFDALLYLGAQASITRAELSPTPRSDAAHMEMRLGRMALLWNGAGCRRSQAVSRARARGNGSDVGPHVANRPSGGGAVNPSPNCPVFAADAVTRVRQLCQRPTARKAGREWQCRFGNKATPSPSSPSRFERSGRPTLRPPTRRAPWSLSCGREA